MRSPGWPTLLIVTMVATACDRGMPTETPVASVGAKYTLIEGELPFYDSGCSQGRSADGKLVAGTVFRLVEDNDGCWLVTLEDEVDTYLRPNRDVIKSRRK